MQTILLCEFYARFRGRKVVTRPSQQFRNLYSRVSFPFFPCQTAQRSLGSFTLIPHVLSSFISPFFFQGFLFLYLYLSSLVFLSYSFSYFIFYLLSIYYLLAQPPPKAPPLLCRPVGTRNSTFFLPHRWPIPNCRRNRRRRPRRQ